MWHFGFPAVERNLNKRGLLHIEYGLLAVLNLESGKELSLGELAARAGMSPSRLTNRLQPLIERKLIQKFIVETDRRSYLARITPAGQRLLNEITPSHIKQVRESFFAQLSDSEIETLGQIVRKIAGGLSDDAWWTSE